MSNPIPTGRRILLVEDDENLGFVIRDNLEALGHKVEVHEDGKSGLNAFLSKQFDLCILDVMLPKMDGFELGQEIRKANSKVPLIFLTARGMKEDRIAGFRLGADDYITKPFSMEELELRIEVLMRRVYGTDESEVDVFQLGDYTFDYRNQLLMRNSEKQQLTVKEAGLLRLLSLHRNEVLTREKALEVVWGGNDYFAGRSMDVYISKLRKYLKEDQRLIIENIHGVGFRLEVSEQGKG